MLNSKNSNFAQTKLDWCFFQKGKSTVADAAPIFFLCKCPQFCNWISLHYRKIVLAVTMKQNSSTETLFCVLKWNRQKCPLINYGVKRIPLIDKQTLLSLSSKQLTNYRIGKTNSSSKVEKNKKVTGKSHKYFIVYYVKKVRVQYVIKNHKKVIV